MKCYNFLTKKKKKQEKKTTFCLSASVLVTDLTFQQKTPESLKSVFFKGRKEEDFHVKKKRESPLCGPRNC